VDLRRAESEGSETGKTGQIVQKASTALAWIAQEQHSGTVVHEMKSVGNEEEV